jgi:trimethylamine--corrinoid protein Co-methyltransferase
MRLVRGIEVTEDTLAVRVIHEVCTGEGHFLGHPQTLSLMNSGYYYPHTADRNTRDRWEAAGAQDMRERAKQRARELLRTQWPTHLPAEVDARLRAEFDLLLPRAVMQPRAARA